MLEAERRRNAICLAGTATVLLVLAIITFCVSRYILGDQKRADAQRAEIARLEAGRDALPTLIAEQQQRREQLTAGWNQILQLLDSRSGLITTGAAPASESARIDFKVALFDVHRRLQEKATSLGATVPTGLGVGRETASDHDAGIDLLQLNAIEALLNMALDHGVLKISNVQPLMPVVPPASPTLALSVIHYPIEMEFDCTWAALNACLLELANPSHYFSLAGLRSERVAINQPDLLHVTLVGDSLALDPQASSLAPDAQP